MSKRRVFCRVQIRTRHISLSRSLAATLAVLLAIHGTAAAQSSSSEPADASSNDVEELARSIAHDALSLSTGDCAVACQALASMQRATARLCALDPGRRCAEARAILDDSSRKVRAACPECAIRAPPSPGKTTEPDREAPVSASAPPSERRGGGCAGCAATGAGGRGLGGVLGAVLGLASLVRRRRRGAEPDSRE